MRISVFGIGYVGTVVAGCLAEDGHEVTAVDIARNKVDAINAGETPIAEPGLGALVAEGARAHRLAATADADDAVAASELSFVCVGTPSLENGNLDLRAVLQVSDDIARGVRKKGAPHKVVVRSTILPGTMDREVIPRILATAAADRVGFAYYPEFMREGAAIEDFRRPATAVIGKRDDETTEILKRLNDGNGAELRIVDIATAEAIKYANNAWHALKVSFANEIGAIGKAAGIDGRRVMEILCADRKLNISSAYLRPGFAFGGSCLPKDLRALRYFAKNHDLSSPVLDAALETNHYQIERAFAFIARALPKRRVAMLGLTFKPDTDDLRESPLVELAERLIGKGFELQIYDPDLELAKMTGSNRLYAMQHLPHLSRLLVTDLGAAVRTSDIVVVGTGHMSFRGIAKSLTPEHHVVDLAGHDLELARHPLYQGTCW
jgi:GDP-mannose 6-dehydrogenase